MPVSKDVPIEEGKLKDNRTKLWTKNVHRFEEFREFGIALPQDLFVRDDLRNFDGEYEAFGSSRGPVGNRSSGRACVKCRVHLDRVKVFGVEPQVFGGSQPFRIKRPLPA